MQKLRIPIMIKIKIVIGVVVAVLVLLGLDFYFTGALVANKYLVASSSSPRLNRSAFVYNYTIRTGDDTLALLTGADMSVTPIGGMQLTGYTENDLRPLVKNICRAWIEQADVTSDFRKVEKAKAVALLSNSPMEGGALGVSGEDVEGLYTTSHYQYYTFESNAGNFNLKKCRCCCCFSEVMATLLVGEELPGDNHTRGMGLTFLSNGANKALPTSGDKIVKVDGRYVQYPLNEIWESGSVPKIKDMVNSGALRVGSVILYAKDKEGTVSMHVDMVVYIDKVSSKLYIAGAGGEVSILKDAVWGYDDIIEYTDSTLLTELDNGDNHWVVNVVHYTECYNVTGGD